MRGLKGEEGEDCALNNVPKLCLLRNLRILKLVFGFAKPVFGFRFRKTSFWFLVSQTADSERASAAAEARPDRPAFPFFQMIFHLRQHTFAPKTADPERASAAA